MCFYFPHMKIFIPASAKKQSKKQSKNQARRTGNKERQRRYTQISMSKKKNADNRKNSLK